jgi:hypothetical protein
MKLLLLVKCLQIWSVLTFLVSAHPGKGVESVSEVEEPIKLILSPSGRVVVRMIGNGGNLQHQITRGVANNILHTPEVLSLVKVKFSICEHKNLYADLGSDSEPSK